MKGRDELHDRTEGLLDALSIVLRAERRVGHHTAIEEDVGDGVAEPLANDARIPHSGDGATPCGGGTCLPTSANICPTKCSGGHVEKAMVPPA